MIAQGAATGALVAAFAIGVPVMLVGLLGFGWYEGRRDRRRAEDAERRGGPTMRSG